LEITNCDIQSGGENGNPEAPVRLHRARCGDALLGSQERSRRADEHSDYAEQGEQIAAIIETIN
jgi:hypothetical protein